MAMYNVSESPTFWDYELRHVALGKVLQGIVPSNHVSLKI